MAESSTTVESGSTSTARAETAKSSFAAQSRATSSAGPSFVRRRSTSSSTGLTHAESDKAEPLLGARRNCPDPSYLTPSHVSTSSKANERKHASARPVVPDVEGEQSNFQPRLGRIREEKERERDANQASPRSSSRSRSRDRPKERSHRRRVIPSEDIRINTGHVYRRGVRHRSGQSVQLQKQLTSIANASVLSVLSSLTAASSSSGGSNSTITQRRYDRGQGYRKRRRRSAQRDSEGEESTGSRHSLLSSRSKRAPITNMDEETLSRSYPGPVASGYAPSQWQPQFRPHSTAGYPETLQVRGPPLSAPSSREGSVTRMDRTNSDSGISMRDNSPEAREKLPKLSPIVRHDSVLDDEDGQEQAEDQRETSNSSDDEDAEPAIDVSQYQVASHDEDLHLREELYDRQDEAYSHILQSPQPRRYHSYTRPRYDVQPGVQHMPYQDLNQPPAYAPRRTSMTGSHMFTAYAPHAAQHQSAAHAYIGDDPSRETKVGYELLANKLSQHDNEQAGDSNGYSFSPLYRRFAFLHHRVLLHLQDEIAELEEELRRVDEAVARQQGQYLHSSASEDSDSAATPQRVPTSRREEVSSGDELCERRSLILGRIYTRLEQYNKALAAYRTATSGFPSASADDIEGYKTWLDANKPIDEAESKFLDFKGDLLAVKSGVSPSPKTSSVEANSAGPSSPYKVAGLAAMTCVPMVLYALAPDVYAKAVVVLGTVAGSVFLSSYVSGWLSLRTRTTTCF